MTIMRLNKGTKVEVLSQREVPSGSWHRAEIICGNGHNYTVKYEGMAGSADKAIVERVPRKAIRPCPPPLSVSENWIPGDIVEVFDNHSWKMATVSKVLGKKYFLIRLLGSSQEFKVSKSHLRLRQYYQDDKWVMIGKVSSNCEEEEHVGNLNPKYKQKSSSQVQQAIKRLNAQVADDYSFVRNKGDFEESRIVSSQTLKRGSPCCYSPAEASAGAAQKFRVIEEEGRHQRLVAIYPSLFPDQVDVVASPQEMLREKYMHDRTNGFSVTEAERRKPNDVVGCSLALNLDPNDADSDICSVGSCSISSNNKSSHHIAVRPYEDNDGHLSDAESNCQLGYREGNCIFPTKENLAAKIHRLELHAYRCTIEALHASGPLSWEQEALMTNLRLSLHISNDEHLMHLKNLGPAETIIPIR